MAFWSRGPGFGWIPCHGGADGGRDRLSAWMWMDLAMGMKSEWQANVRSRFVGLSDDNAPWSPIISRSTIRRP